MNNEYILDGKVQRDKIAMDIKYRKLKCSDIEKIVEDPIIKDAFIGESYTDKRPKSEWDKAYLDLLSYAVVGESFNRDYLLYLDEVAEFVSKTKFKKMISNGGKMVNFDSRVKFKKVVIAGVVVILVIIAGIVMYYYVSTGGKI